MNSQGSDSAAHALMKTHAVRTRSCASRPNISAQVVFDTRLQFTALVTSGSNRNSIHIFEPIPYHLLITFFGRSTVLVPHLRCFIDHMLSCSCVHSFPCHSARTSRRQVCVTSQNQRAVSCRAAGTVNKRHALLGSLAIIAIEWPQAAEGVVS